jgi:cob(I)alamin adenosyltransferase
MSLYTRNGDHGQTRRLDGGVVFKCDPLCCAEGSLDELTCHLGLCAVEAERLGTDKATRRGRFDELAGSCRDLQRHVHAVGAMLATAGTDYAGGVKGLDSCVIEQMEAYIDRVTAELPALNSFILPGGCELSARLHVARTVCRRAERDVVAAGVELAAPAGAFLNRLGDLLFVLARLANVRLGYGEASP